MKQKNTIISYSEAFSIIFVHQSGIQDYEILQTFYIQFLNIFFNYLNSLIAF